MSSILCRRVAFAVAMAVLPFLAGEALSQEARVVPASPQVVKLSLAPVAKRAAPSVVNVYAARVVENRNRLLDDPIFRQFFGGSGSGEQVQRSLGSGVIVDGGLVVTNNHVIERMDQVKVSLADKREFEAEIVLKDPRSDLAILRLKDANEKFPAIELGDSDTLQVGDFVLAIGNPFGVGQTVTQGIVSALARTHVGISDYGFFIQTDAAINPGNSGGPLVDMNGRLVGINSAIFSKSGGSVGIGFAIPANMVKSVVAAAKGGGKQVRRAWMGASLQTLSQEIADGLGLDRPTGALLADVDPKGPSAEAGLKRGDVIVSVDGQTADDPEAVGYRLATKPLGGQATLGVLRGGKKIAAQIRLTPAPETPARDAVKIKGASPFAGATVVNISPAVIEEMSVQGATNGVVVSEIDDGTFAQQLNLQRGDVILAVNDQKIETTRDLEKVTSGRSYYWKITLARGGQVLTTVVGG